MCLTVAPPEFGVIYQEIHQICVSFYLFAPLAGFFITSIIRIIESTKHVFVRSNCLPLAQVSVTSIINMKKRINDVFVFN